MKGVIDVLDLQSERESQNRVKLINYADPSSRSNFNTVRYIFECGIKLKMQSTTMMTAARIYHKFASVADMSNYDVYLIGSTCLFLSSKMKDEHVKLRDIINVSHHTIHRDSSPLELGDRYWAMRDALVQAELLVMRMIKFEPDSQNTPYKYLVQYFNSLQGWLKPKDWKDTPLIQTALSFLTDFHHDSSIINHKSEHVAIACLFLSMQCYGIAVPHAEETDPIPWFAVFDDQMNKDKLWEITEGIMNVYGKEPK